MDTEWAGWPFNGEFTRNHMANNTIELRITFKISPERLYNAWLDSAEHSEMTGTSSVASAIAGAEFKAWDGYISGKNLELVDGRKIVQSWRTTDFLEEDPDSRLEIRFDPAPGGSVLTLIHSDIPEGQPDYAEGWREYYFEPMKAYFEQ